MPPNDPGSDLKLAVSNIAWPPRLDAQVAGVLRESSVRAVEIAPTRRWADPAAASADAVSAYRGFWSEHGLTIVSLQALLFGRDDLLIFKTASSREATAAYLERVMGLAGALGASRLVFGSPKNRRRDQLDPRDADRIAIEFFRRLGRAAVANGVTLCIEPNPVEYGCDFLTNAIDCIAFLERVNSEGIALHLDSGAMTLTGEDPRDIVPAADRWLRHFHISEPFLQMIGSGLVDHAAFADALASAGFAGWLSIEMRAPDDDSAVETVRRAVAYAQKVYAAVGRA